MLGPSPGQSIHAFSALTVGAVLAIVAQLSAQVAGPQPGCIGALQRAVAHLHMHMVAN